ncbi:hypothetical protein [Thiohalospira halophila]|uniref:hypothetical protein n=1 Tax=Thiohalospira halophila TaxID=381300 RepID=UPI000AD4712F|nr:hypothetical protein [Thiohalospira halophila]
MPADMRITAAELEALSGLPYPAQVLYLTALRPHMDYASGTVGIRRRVSWQSLGEALYVEPHQGLKGSGAPSKEQVRRYAGWLERAGLVSMESAGLRLVFRCLMAQTDDSAQKKPDTIPTQSRHPHPDTPEPAPLGESGEEADTIPHTPENPKADTPPGSGIRSPRSPSGAGARSSEHASESAGSVAALGGAKVVIEELSRTGRWGLQRLQSTRVVRMAASLAGEGVTPGDVQTAIAAVDARGMSDYGPEYLAGPIRDAMQTRQQEQSNAGSGSVGRAGGGGAGARRRSQSDEREDYLDEIAELERRGEL